MTATTQHRRPHLAGGASAGVAFLAFLLVAVLQLAAESATLKPYDEGLILYGASRVAQGAMPYRDFWSMYGPGSFVTLAGLDRIFGESVLVGRLFDVAARAGVVMLVFAQTRQLAGRAVALLCALAAFGLLIGVREYLFPALPATTFVLLTLYALGAALRRRDAGSPWAWALAGAAAGASFLFRPDFGLCALFGCLWALLVPVGRERFGARRPLACVAALAGGAVAVAGPMFAWLLAGVPAADAYDNLVRLPMEVYVANRALPFPEPVATLRDAFEQDAPRSALTLAVYLPPCVAFLGATMAIVGRFRGVVSSVADQSSQRHAEALLMVLLLLCAKGAVRAQVLHMLPALVVSIVAVGSAFRGTPYQGDRAWRRAVAATCLVAGLGLVAEWVRARQVAHQSSTPSALMFAYPATCGVAHIPRLGCFMLDPDRAAVLRYLAEHARPEDRLYVGAGRHDKLFISNVELYFLSGLPAATRWADLHPGVQTTAAIQRAMIGEMAAHPPAFVVLNTAWDDRQEPNASRESSGVTLLDDYLRTRYAPAFHAGSFTVSLPRAEGQP